MRVAGYRLKGYDATYERCSFDLDMHFTEDSCVLHVTELNSGVSYLLDLDNKQAKSIKRRINKNKSKYRD